MFTALQVVTLILVAFTMAPAVAHALEYPGKLWLSKDAYMTVQRIYYPGFTMAGVMELVSVISALALVVLTPRDSPAFALSLAALLLLVAMHVVYWTVTAPVNKVWLKDEQLSKAGTAFFRTDKESGKPQETDWKHLRDRWEYSHIARAVLVTVALGTLACAVALAD